MSVQIEEISPCRRKLKIEVPAETITSEYEDALGVYQKQVQLPGFRPGKAPRAMVKARYNKDILGRLRDHILPKSYHDALGENNLSVINIIEMDEDIEVKEGQPMSYSITVDIRPEIDLPAYKGLSLKREQEEVDDAEVDERIEALRNQRADYEDVEDRPVSRGDMAQIDFTATLDGVPLEEAEPGAKGLGEAKDFWLQASDEAFIPELGLELAGMAVGDERDIAVTFNDDFVVEGLRGKAVVFKVTVKAVRARKLPELDEAFFTSIGAEDEEDFRKQIRGSIEQEKARQAEGKLRRDIEAFLLEKTEVALPESLVSEASSQHVRRIAGDLQQNGEDEASLMEKKDEIVQTATAAAERQVKLRLILQKIGAEQGIDVSEQELSREISMLSYAYQMNRDEFEQRLRKNNQLDDLRGDVLCRKVVDWVLENAEVEGAPEPKEDDA
jgi:trigger factor